MTDSALKTLVSWSTGKDSAWMLYRLLTDPEFHVSGLYCTINAAVQRTAMHAVRVDLLKTQAERMGLPLEILELPYPCSNKIYEKIMQEFVDRCIGKNIDCFAFGDLFLEDIRDYRIGHLAGTGIDPVFPIWGEPTDRLAVGMIESGIRAVVTCVDPKQLDPGFVGRKFDQVFLDQLPPDVDPCGENGEFHTFVYDAPMFRQPIEIEVGEKLERDGFCFADILPG